MKSKKIESHDVFTISQMTKVRIYCLLMMFVVLKIDTLLNLSIKDCVFITSIIDYSDKCSIAIVIGHTHMLKEA